MLQYVTAKLFSLLEQQNIEKDQVFLSSGLTAVSYTHLTLPTNREV